MIIISIATTPIPILAFRECLLTTIGNRFDHRIQNTLALSPLFLHSIARTQSGDTEMKRVHGTITPIPIPGK